MAEITREEAVSLLRASTVTPQGDEAVVNVHKGLVPRQLPLAEAEALVDSAHASYLRDDVKTERLMLDLGNSEVYRIDVDDRGHGQ